MMSDSTSSPSVSVEDVAKLAGLARIELKPEEHERMAGELQAILSAVATVSEVATDDVPATSHPMPLTNVFRVDRVEPGLTPPEALSGAPAAESDRFRVPRILDEE